MRELRLAVGAQVFVAKATRDLVVLIQAGDHANLFEDLGRLRQREEFSRLYARRHDVITRAFGRRLNQIRSFDLRKALLVHVPIDLEQQPMAQTQVRLQLRPAQIEITIFQTQIFARQRLSRRGIELKRKRARVVENDKVAGLDFDIAGCMLWIARAFIAQRHLPGYGQNVFTAHFFGFGVGFLRVLLIHYYLSNPVAITQIDERERAKVAPTRTPTHQHDARAHIFLAQRAARMRTFKIAEVVDH